MCTIQKDEISNFSIKVPAGQRLVVKHSYSIPKQTKSKKK